MQILIALVMLSAVACVSPTAPTQEPATTLPVAHDVTVSYSHQPRAPQCLVPCQRNVVIDPH